MGEEVSHLKAHVNTFYNNGALQRASEQPHLKTNQKPSQINKKVGSQETSNLTEAAANLFAALHSLNETGRPIAVTPIPDHGLGAAINDRLRRAAAPRDS